MNKQETVVTVVTPTYNRANQLYDLWESMKRQTSNNFEWLIIDDGSTDNTIEIIQQFQREKLITVRFLKKENGGKHTALNLGIKHVHTPLTFIVDSDDTLTKNAIETIEQYYCKYQNMDSICGFSFLRTYPNGVINGKNFKIDEWETTYIEARINADDTMSDKAEVYKTSCLLEYPFPEIEDEKFLGEDVVWVRLARKYKMIHINESIYIGNYQQDGLTKNRRKHNFQSPRGCTIRALEFMHKDIKLKYQIKAVLQHLIYGKTAGYSYGELYAMSQMKLWSILLTPAASVIKRKWEKEIIKKD